MALVKYEQENTYMALADNVAWAANKQHITVLNPANSGKIVRLRKLFGVNLQLAAVTGVATRFDLKRCTGVSGGTAIVEEKADTLLPASGITVSTNGTVTGEGAIVFPITICGDEVGATQSFINYQSINWLPEGAEIQEISLRPGEGLTLKQITSTAVGVNAWLLIFTTQPV